MDSIIFDINEKKKPIVVVGLGYVGLPLVCAFAREFKVIGYDINQTRVEQLQMGFDDIQEVNMDTVPRENITFTSDASCFAQTSFIVIAVPTPIDNLNKPDLKPIYGVTETIGRNIQKNTIVVLESTVYPGLTETICRDQIEKFSGLKYLEDFYLGYSPERINPGDKKHSVDNVVKVIAGCDRKTTDALDAVYSKVIPAGTYRATSIQVAEAAKVIENTQRDLNIALINELSMIFHKIGIDTHDVLKAAGTKWNFMPFEPGLVGGHCIGVDPFYLTYLAQSHGLHPQVVLAGRKINDDMPQFVVENLVKNLIKNRKQLSKGFKVGILGATFKEDIKDLRNSKVLNLMQHLKEYGAEVFCVDPICNASEFKHEFSHELTHYNDLPTCDAIILAVKHQHFKDHLPLEVLASKLNPEYRFLIDLKAIYSRTQAKQLDIDLWRL